MTVSETTTLLPNRHFHPNLSTAGRRERRGYFGKHHIALVFALIIGFTGIILFSRQTVETTTVNTKTTSSPTLLPFNDLEILQWDDWKNDVDQAKTWVGGMTNTVQDEVQADTNHIAVWWDSTAPSRDQFVQMVSNNANKVSHQIKLWWDDTTTNTEKSLSDADIPDKVTTIENNFQHWWKNANHAEREWWNHTIEQFQIDEQQGTAWLKEKGSALSVEGSELGKAIKDKSAVIFDATKNELGKETAKLGNLENKWATSAQETLKSDEQIVGNTAIKLWNSTEHAVVDDEQKSLKVGTEWMKDAKDVAQSDAMIAVQKGSDLLNNTGTVLNGDAVLVSEKAKDWFNTAKSSFQDETDIALQNGSNLLNATEASLKGDVALVSDKAQDLFISAKSSLKDDAAIVLEKGSGLLNVTGEALNGDIALVSDKAKGWLNNGETSIKDEGMFLWNETEDGVHHVRDIAEQKFALWWATTKSMAQKDVHQVSDVEEGWWNASEIWLHNHVQLPKIVSRAAAASTTMQEKSLLYLNTSFAYSLLMNGYHWYDYSNDFFLYQQGWDVQINQAYCAVASAAAVINSFHSTSFSASVPIDPLYDPHEYATQTDLFNDCVTETVVYHNATFDGVMAVPGGLTLDQLNRLLQCHHLDAKAYYVDPTNVTVDNVRQNIEEALMNPNKRVIVNFDRQAIGQSGGGHFSPIGSYSKKDDCFLLMDVAKYKYPPVWIPTQLLYGSLATEDACGDWLYPSGQNKLMSHGDPHRPNSVHAYQSMMKTLHCHKRHRGYIIVQLPS